LASSDNGVHWTRRSTIASYLPDPADRHGKRRPPVESSVVQLNNGKLLLGLSATGQPFPGSDIKSHPAGDHVGDMSADQWPDMEFAKKCSAWPAVFSITPQDGRWRPSRLTFGRYGAKIMFADENRPAMDHAHGHLQRTGQGGHTDIKKLNNGNYCFVYDQSSFLSAELETALCRPLMSMTTINPAILKSAILSIQHLPTSGRLSLGRREYHGDLSPDSLPAPMDQDAERNGQSIPLGGSGAGLPPYGRPTPPEMPRHRTNSLAGKMASAWQGINFSKGWVVLELRAPRPVPVQPRRGRPTC